MKQNPLATKAIFSINENSMHALKKKEFRVALGSKSVLKQEICHTI
jgi:hypothetical protein